MPVEPTEEMIEAFQREYVEVSPQRTPGLERRVRLARTKIGYRAMISAAPAPSPEKPA